MFSDSTETLECTFTQESSRAPRIEADSVEVRVVRDSEGTPESVPAPPVVQLPADVFSRPMHLRPALVPVTTPPSTLVEDLRGRARVARMVASARLHGMTADGREPRVAQLRELVDYLLEELDGIEHCD
ncbi:hypothetical protein POM88_035852 [Heracleum sosnowskyi]|uniref:Uncharacterized protein n=1 Tax=Heracleum sosnowskyi TaxID=360622 RepID=A0AAD8HP92_9APIA|nr:hypothetical protein POM88_035852 [Heracleum sosnowskyi]